MSTLSVNKSYGRRRRFSREFKAQVVAECLEPGASASRIAFDNGLNVNMVWLQGKSLSLRTALIRAFRVTRQ